MFLHFLLASVSLDGIIKNHNLVYMGGNVMDPRPIFFKSAIGGFLVFLFAAISYTAPGFFTDLWLVLASGDVDEISDFILSFGDKAWYFAFFLTALVNSIGFPPAILFSAANTLIFGLVPGILLSWVAETVGVAISFILLRTIFRETALRLAKGHPKMEMITEISGRKGYRIMLLARLIPYFPSIVLNAFGALSAMSFRDYLLASFIGKFPSTAIEAVMGHDIVTISQHPQRLAFTILLAAILYLAFRWYDKRRSM